MGFDTEVTLTGPWRSPAQMLAEQQVGGHASVHDADAAAGLGLVGAPIEGPTHFSQFDPLAVMQWGQAWFETGCISCHFQSMVVEGEQVQASMTTTSPTAAGIAAHKVDGTTVLVGTASVGRAGEESELTRRLADRGDPGDLFIVDQLDVGMRIDHGVTSITRSERNGGAYPFSLEEKLARITEPHAWYTDAGGVSSPWGRAVLPMEMVSVLSEKAGNGLPVRTPAMGLFLDLEVRLVSGPVFVDQEYAIVREVVGLGQSRRTESYWTRTTITEPGAGQVVAEVLLHSGLFKESYPGYPRS